MRRPKKRFIPLFLKSTLKVNCTDILAARDELVEDRLKLANDWKASGNKLIQSSSDSHKEAAAFYAKAMSLFVYLPDGEEEGEPVRDYGEGDDIQEKVKSLVLSALLNTALCYIKLKEFKHGIHACNHALEINAQSVKALYRRSECHLGLGADWATRHGSATVGGGAGFADATMGCAVKDLEAAHLADPNNKAVKAALAKYRPYIHGPEAPPTVQKKSTLKFKKPTAEQKKKRQEKISKAFSKGGLYGDMPNAPEAPSTESTEPAAETDSPYTGLPMPDAGLPSELAAKIEDTMLDSAYEENGLMYTKDGSPLI
jgi:tetratricopeptide (TPR) repeat protein